jgi:hypothetical protein
MKGAHLIIFSLLIMGTVWFVQGPRAEAADNNRPQVSFGDAFSGNAPPLEKAIKDKVTKRRNEEKKELNWKGSKIKPKEQRCLDALALPDTDQDKEYDIQKNCKKSPGQEKKVLEKEDIIKGGKKKGKKIKTQTTLKFENAGQRYGNEKRQKWDHVVIRPPETGDLKAQSYRNKTNTKDKARKKTLLVDDPRRAQGRLGRAGWHPAVLL